MGGRTRRGEDRGGGVEERRVEGRKEREMRSGRGGRRRK